MHRYEKPISGMRFIVSLYLEVVNGVLSFLLAKAGDLKQNAPDHQDRGRFIVAIQNYPTRWLTGILYHSAAFLFAAWLGKTLAGSRIASGFLGAFRRTAGRFFHRRFGLLRRLGF